MGSVVIRGYVYSFAIFGAVQAVAGAAGRVSVVRELYGVMAAEGAAGYVVTSGTFTKDARQFAAGRNVELIDGQGLDALSRDGRGAESKLGLGEGEAHAGKNAAPMCPRFKTPMVMRCGA
jgi:restriction system protein